MGLIAIGIVFGSFSLTGNVVAESTKTIFGMGAGFFLVGLAGLFFSNKK